MLQDNFDRPTFTFIFLHAWQPALRDAAGTTDVILPTSMFHNALQRVTGVLIYEGEAYNLDRNATSRAVYKDGSS